MREFVLKFVVAAEHLLTIFRQFCYRLGEFINRVWKLKGVGLLPKMGSFRSL